MTIPDSNILDKTATTKTERTVPEIKGEEDLPFPTSAETAPASTKAKPIDKRLSQTDDLTKFRFETGRIVLYIAMGAMGLLVLADLIATHCLAVESDMLENAFEAFKLITMTVLGYIFGSSSSDSTK